METILSIGLIAVGLIALGVVAAACVSIGVFAFGAFAVGDFSVGALAIGKYFAIGEHAQGIIANRAAVKEALDTVVPTYLAWAKEHIKAFL